MTHARAGMLVASAVLLSALPACSKRGGERERQDVAVVPVPAVSPQRTTRREAFDVAAIQPVIVDIGMSTDLRGALERASADVVVNGGFFAPGGAPIGLAVSDGKVLSAFSPRMSGGVLWRAPGAAVMQLTATEEYAERPVDFAIQCRPRLVVASRVNIRTDDGRRAARTALCLRDGGRTLEVDVALDDHDAGPTLRELAEELAASGCEEALNLDGGPSTGWAARTNDAVDVLSPRGPVRHVLAIKTGRSRARE
jgi:uncharacterized protein YigE (DUF2233 family)